MLGRSLIQITDAICVCRSGLALADFAGVVRFVPGDNFIRHPKTAGLPPAREGTVSIAISTVLSTFNVFV